MNISSDLNHKKCDFEVKYPFKKCDFEVKLEV